MLILRRSPHSEVANTLSPISSHALTFPFQLFVLESYERFNPLLAVDFIVPLQFSIRILWYKLTKNILYATNIAFLVIFKNYSFPLNIR